MASENLIRGRKEGRPGKGRSKVFHASSSSELLLCLIGQNCVTWLLLAARETGTVGYVAEAGHIAALNTILDRISWKDSIEEAISKSVVQMLFS